MRSVGLWQSFPLCVIFEESNKYTLMTESPMLCWTDPPPPGATAQLGQGRLVVEVSGSHAVTHHSR